jgi:hypothetical protein
MLMMASPKQRTVTTKNITIMSVMIITVMATIMIIITVMATIIIIITATTVMITTNYILGF